MLTESVQALKLEIASCVLPGVAERLEARKPVFAVAGGKYARAIAAASISDPDEGAAGIALGRVPGRDGSSNRLAVRIQNYCLLYNAQAYEYLVQELEARTKGQFDLSFVGQINAGSKDDDFGRPWHRSRARPLRVGCSIGHFESMTGTIGGFFRRRGQGDDHVYILSNNHVLANNDHGEIGDPILQPGPVHGGCGSDRIGTLAAKEPLTTTMGGKPHSNHFDAALCLVDTGCPCDHRLDDLGTWVKGMNPTPLAGEEPVRKIGCETQQTDGRVKAIELDGVLVSYADGRVMRFDGQIEIEGSASPFGRVGDSGALIVDGQGHGRALLFAVSDEGGHNGIPHTFANPIGPIMDRFGIDLLA
jgi:hypothetical protein